MPVSDAAELKPRLQAAVRFARQAGAITLDYFQRHDLAVETKSDDSPVTAADRHAEETLRNCIDDAFPHDGIIGEEFPERTGSSDFYWILDPIDGTKSLIHGVPLYGTLVGVQHQGQPAIGVINIPALGEMVFGGIGQGAWYAKGDAAPTPCRVSDRTALSESLFLTSEVRTFDERGAEEVFRHFNRAARLTRTWGDCYGYLMVATGRADLMIDPIMNLWDAAALLPVLVEAGGAYTDWQGEATVANGEGVGSNGRLHDQIIAITRGYPRQANDK